MAEGRNRRRAVAGSGRPAAQRAGPVLALAALTVIILLVVGAWAIGGGAPAPTNGGGEVFETLLSDWQKRWPDVEPESSRYRSAAQDAAVADQAGAASMNLQKALLSDPDDLESWLLLACLSARGGPRDLPDLDQARRIADEVAARDPEHPDLPAARAWLLLSADQVNQALEALGDADGLEAHWARWEALSRLPERWDEAQAAGMSLLDLEPAHLPACVGVARAWVGAAEPARAWAVAERCVGAGAAEARLLRMQGDILDSLGQFDSARQAWEEAGATTHAAAVALQEGGDRDQAEALLAGEAGLPPAMLHQIWAAVLAGDAEASAAAAAAVRDAGLEGPEFRLAWSAAALLNDAPETALDELGDDPSAAAFVLRGRAGAALGDDAAAREAFEQARALEPLNAAPLREELAWLARVDGPAAERLVDEAARGDLVAYGLALDDRDRDRPWPALCPSPWPIDRLDARSAALVAALAGVPVAARRLDREVAAAPNDALAWMLRAWTALRSDQADAEGALLAARRATSLEPHAAVPHLLASLAALRLDRLDVARAELAAAGQAPDAPQIGLGFVAARVAVVAGEADAAERVSRVVLAAPETSGLLRMAWHVGGGEPSVLSRPMGGPRGWALDK